VRAALTLAALAGCVLAIGAGPAAASGECRGLTVCVPVAGPWVVLSHGPVQYLLKCPDHFVVGGTDAVLSERAIDITFLGNPGAPINPGVTTTTEALFIARYVGTGSAPVTVQPHIGCIPQQGGGGRVPLAVRAFPPGQPTLRRAKQVALGGIRRVAIGCAAGERFVSGWHALGLTTSRQPPDALVRFVSATEVVRNGRVFVTATGPDKAVVQVGVVCAGGR
jgi:hypothetical protein